MRFAALTGSEAILLGLLTAGLLLGSYLLKTRQRRIIIASSVLWRRTIEHQKEQSLFRRMRRFFSAALVIFGGLLIAMAIARPEIEAITGNTERIVLVLDTSPTMLARTADGTTRWEHAQKSATSLLTGHGNAAIRVADTSGRYDSAFTADRRAIRQMVARMAPGVAPQRFPAIDGSNAQVLFITDGVSGVTPPASVRKLSVLEKAENTGITAFQILSAPTAPLTYEAYIEVHNYGQKPHLVEIGIHGPQQEITRNIAMDPGNYFRESFDLSQFKGGTIQASVKSDGDAFALDDVAYGYLPLEKRVRTLLVTKGNPNLVSVLKLNPLVDLTVIPPEQYQDDAKFDAMIFDRFAPLAPPSRAALIIGAQDVPWLRKGGAVVTRPAFKSWSEDHPVMQFVSLHEVSVEKALRIDASNLTVLASSGDTPLIVASEQPRWVLMTFDLQSSDFAHHVGFPVFMENVLGWLRAETPTLYRAPGTVDVPLAGAEIHRVDGKVVASRAHSGSTVFESEQPGLFLANQGESRVYVAVNLADPDTSNINRGVLAGTNALGLGQRLIQHEPWFYMLIAAALLVGLEWFTFHRSITQ